MPTVPLFVPAPVVDERGYSPFARRASACSLPRRPTSAQPSLPKRPASAKPHRPHSAKTSSSSPTCQSVDYLGISNMMKSINFKSSRKWREKSPDADTTSKGRGHHSPPPRRTVAWKEKNEEEELKEKENANIRNAPKTSKNSRHNRSSNFSKFKYPQQYHYGSSASRVNYLERNIPQCLRRGPRYANQPVRQNCNFNPINSVTHLKWHSIRSKSLPGYKGPGVAKPQLVSTSEPDEETKPEATESDEWQNGPRTGSYEYVYQGGSKSNSQVLFDEEEEDEMYADELNNNQTPREAVISVLNSEGESDAESVAEEHPESVVNQRSIPPPREDAAEEVEEIPESMDDADNARTGHYGSTVSREPDHATGYLDYQDYVDDAIEEDVKDKDKDSVAGSVKSSKSSKSSKSVKSASSKSRSRKSSKSSNHSFKYGDADIDEILGSDDGDDLIDQYMNSLKTPRAEPTQDGRASRMSADGRFSRLGGDEVTRDGKFRKAVRIHEPRDFSDAEIPEDKESGGSVDSFSMQDLPPLSMLGSGSEDPQRRRRVVRPMTAVRRNLEEEDF